MKSATLKVRSRKGTTEELKHLIHAKFEDAEFDRLVDEWASFKNSGQPTLGRYKYVSNEAYSGNEEREIIIDFTLLGVIT